MIKEFHFSRLYFSLENILDGQDYNGSLVSAPKVQDFVAMNRKKMYGRTKELACKQTYDELLQDKAECNSVEVVAQNLVIHTMTEPSSEM